MATLRDIKRRIVGVKNTQKITKAMKMVATAKLRRAQQRIINARPYAGKISEMLSHLVTQEEIASNPEIPLTQVKERRFDLIERAQDLAKAQIQAAEDARAFDVMDAVATVGFDNLGSDYVNAQVNAVAPLTPANLSDAMARVETHDLRVARVFVNALDFADMRKWGRDVLDPETQGSLLKTGLMGTLWGAQVIVTRKVAPGYVYVTAEPEFFGRIPVRTELTVLSADDPKARRIGFSVFENLGIGCHNPLALTRVKIAR